MAFPRDAMGLSANCLWFVIVVFPDHTHYLFKDFANEESAGSFTFVVFLTSCDGKYYMLFLAVPWVVLQCVIF